MDSSKTTFMISILVIMATIILFATPTHQELLVHNGRFLAQSRPRGATTTCDKFPRVCAAKGSPGPDCCNKRCVNVKSDRLNCEMCGKQCKYSEICCQGKCVNLSVNENHCGRCNKKCKYGGSCVYGMCNYS